MLRITLIAVVIGRVTCHSYSCNDDLHYVRVGGTGGQYQTPGAFRSGGNLRERESSLDAKKVPYY